MEVVMLETHRLLDPPNPAREEMDDALLDSLEESIRQMGVLEPLLVTPAKDGAFEVVAGHRRIIAIRRCGLPKTPCVIETDSTRLDAIKIHENLEREDLSPAAEAVFYAELYDKLGQDTDKVAERVKRSRSHIEDRLVLLRGNPDIFAALREGKISLGVAREFNKLTREEDVAYYLSYARRTGVSVNLARQWRQEANARAEHAAALEAARVAGGTGGADPPPAPPLKPNLDAAQPPWAFSSSKELRPCLFCGQEDEEWKRYKRFVCRLCAEEVEPKILKAMRGEPAP